MGELAIKFPKDFLGKNGLLRRNVYKKILLINREL